MKTLRAYESVSSDLQPFQMSFPSPGQMILTLSSRINGWPDISRPESLAWMAHTQIGMITMDLGKLTDIHSATLAWMINVAQRVPNGKVYLTGCNASIQRSIKILNVHRTLCVVATDSGLLRMS
jgi:hypothetical protein